MTYQYLAAAPRSERDALVSKLPITDSITRRHRLSCMKSILSCGYLVVVTTFAHAEQSLEQAASDPTASLMSVQLSDWHTINYHHSDADDNTVVLRSALPFTIGEQKHILRVTIPVITDNPALDNGLSDSTLFDLAVFDRDWGRFGVGLVGLLPTGGSESGTEKWGVGPALGFTVQADGFLWGLFNQNIFTIAGDIDRSDVNQSSLQPIFNKKLGSGWSLGFSEMQITYDWEARRWSNLPLGAGINKMQKFGALPVQFNFQYEHNFADDKIAPSNTIRLSAKLLLPTG